VTYTPTGNARKIAEALNGAADGAGWSCRCPAHPDSTPSLYIVERGWRVVLYCHAGCSRAAIIAALRQRGLWPHTLRGRRDQRDNPKLEPTRRAGDPLKPWQMARCPDVRGTLLETYFKSRALVLTDVEAAALRFDPGAFHWPTRGWWPVMIALVKRADGAELAAHQTFIARDGYGKAPVDRPRLFPGGSAPNGGAVWFGAPCPDQEFLVGEGVESTLSAMRLTDTLSGCAALSTLGIRRLILPPEAKRVCIFADRDPADQRFNAARVACARWRSEGLEVRITLPERIGEDANSILVRRAAQGIAS
jgi:putative DNA primase/helicase